MHKKLHEKFLVSIHHHSVPASFLPWSLTLTDVPLWVEMVAGVTVTDVAVQAVLTVSMTTNVPA